MPEEESDCKVVNSVMQWLRTLVLSTSMMWFNYRHAANAFAFAAMLERNGIDRREVLIGVGSDPAFDVRNPMQGRVFHSGEDVHSVVDFVGDDVSIEVFRAVLLHGPVRGRATEFRARRRMVVYLTGHGGEEFLKFRNAEELRAVEFAEIIETMKRVNGFDEMLVILDTCQADTFFRHVRTDGVVTLASSMVGEYAKSEVYDEVLGVPVCDLFSRELVRLVPKLGPNASLVDLRNGLAAANIGSTPVLRVFGANRSVGEMTLGEFFW